jgi:hypothetical protein
MRRALLLLFASACTSGPTPTVEIVSATPQALNPADDLADDLRILVTYEDGDGDLGRGSARVHDCRAEGLITELEIPAIAADEMIGSKITGSLDLAINDVGVATTTALPTLCSELGVSLAADTTVFCVELVDAAGNVGEGDCTESIAIAP